VDKLTGATASTCLRLFFAATGGGKRGGGEGGGWVGGRARNKIP